MGIVEWHGQLLTKNPDNGGKRIFDLDGRFSPSTGYSELSMDSAIDGNVQQVDYLVVAGRTYFNSEVVGPQRRQLLGRHHRRRGPQLGAADRPRPDLAGHGGPRDHARRRRRRASASPPRTCSPACRAACSPTVPAALDDVEARAVITPHGHLIEVGVDVVNMWNDAAPRPSSRRSTRASAGWWAMTMKESQDGTDIVPPQYVFDPTVTPPSQCKRG